jgi:hypothetical protein
MFNGLDVAHDLLPTHIYIVVSLEDMIRFDKTSELALQTSGKAGSGTRS